MQKKIISGSAVVAQQSAVIAKKIGEYASELYFQVRMILWKSTTNPISLKMTKTVQNHMFDRTKSGALARLYMTNGTISVVNYIINAASPIRDTALEFGAKWVVPGNYNGVEGVWELVIDCTSNIIVHFLFNK